MRAFHLADTFAHRRSAENLRKMQLTRLGEWRLRRGLTQEQLAKLAGVNRTALIRIEHGRETRLSTARKLATALDVDPEELAERIVLTRPPDDL